MHILRQDLSYAARLLVRNPAFSVAAILTLAIGIGGVTSIFSVVHGVMLRPLPYGDPEGLVEVSVNPTSLPTSRGARIPPEADWPFRQRVFEEVLEYRTVTTFLVGQGEPEIQFVPRVPVTFLDFLRVQPLLGRGFVAEDASDPPTVALISYGFWRERLGGDPNVLGTEIRTERATLTIVGVMPPGFSFEPIGDSPVDLWIPRAPGGARGFATVARLAPGVTVEAAAAELTGIVTTLESEYPGSAQREVRVTGLLDATIGADWSLVLMLFLGAVGFVLVIAVANTANLMLARGVGREREIAIRSAIGSTRCRLIRQLLVESVLLSLLGGVLSVGIAFWALRVIVAALPPGFPRVQDIAIDGEVLGGTLAMVLLAGIAFGIGPALSFSAPALDRALKEGSGRTTDSGWHRRFRSALVAGEVALATILLIGGLLLARSFVQLMGTPLGMEIENVVSATVTTPAVRYDANRRRALLGDLAERLRSRPDVVAVSQSNLRGMGVGSDLKFTIGDEAAASIDGVTSVLEGGPEIFQVLGIGLTSGRAFREAEVTAVVVTESFVDRYFPGQDPLGRRIGLGGDLATIVGVSRDFRQSGPTEEPVPTVIMPSETFVMSLLVKVRGDPRALMDGIRSEVRGRDPALVLSQTTLEDSLYALDAVSQPRFRTAVLGAFAAIALLLALVGIASVTAYSAARRGREVGIRIALGGTRTGIRRMMLAQAMTPVLIGVLVGIIGASALTGLISSYLYEVGPADPAVFAAASLALLLTATVAAWLPLRRSTAAEPMVALHHE